MRLAESTADVREHVERALRTRADYAGDVVQHGQHFIALLLELGTLGGRHVLRTGQRRRSGHADDFRHVGDVVGVHRHHGLRHRFRPGHETHAPTRHAIGLGQRVDEDHAVAQLGTRLHEVVVADAVEHHAVVDVVGDDPGRVLHQHVGQCGDFVLRIDHAGRVGRVVEQEHAGVFGQRRVQLFGRQLVVLLWRTGQQVHLGAEDFGDVHVAGPIRRGEGDLVTLVQQYFSQVVEDVLGADGGCAVLAGVAVEADALHVLEEGIQQVVGATVAAVLATVVRQRFARRGIDVLAWEEIGNADRETDDVATFGLQALGLLGDFHDRAGLGAAHALGELEHRLGVLRGWIFAGARECASAVEFRSLNRRPTGRPAGAGHPENHRQTMKFGSGSLT